MRAMDRCRRSIQWLQLCSRGAKFTLNRKQKRSEYKDINWVYVEECSTVSIPLKGALNYETHGVHASNVLQGMHSAG